MAFPSLSGSVAVCPGDVAGRNGSGGRGGDGVVLLRHCRVGARFDMPGVVKQIDGGCLIKPRLLSILATG